MNPYRVIKQRLPPERAYGECPHVDWDESPASVKAFWSWMRKNRLGRGAWVNESTLLELARNDSSLPCEFYMRHYLETLVAREILIRMMVLGEGTKYTLAVLE